MIDGILNMYEKSKGKIIFINPENMREYNVDNYDVCENIRLEDNEYVYIFECNDRRMTFDEVEWSDSGRELLIIGKDVGYIYVIILSKW